MQANLRQASLHYLGQLTNAKQRGPAWNQSHTCWATRQDRLTIPPSVVVVLEKAFRANFRPVAR